MMEKNYEQVGRKRKTKNKAKEGNKNINNNFVSDSKREDEEKWQGKYE